jgi:hypothetical protein
MQFVQGYLKMKNKIFIIFLLIIFLLFFYIKFISSEADSTDYSANTITGGLSSGNFSSDDFTGEFGTLNNPSLSSYEIGELFCGDGICNGEENCLSCLADCGCASGYSCSSLGTCTIIPPITTTTGGGGGGTTIISTQFFSLSTEQIKVNIQQGRVTSREVTITNNQNTELTFNVSAPKISDYINIQETSFTLKPGESKTLKIGIMALKDAVPNLYMGELIFKTTNTEKRVLVAIEVESANPIFDVSAKIPDNFLYVMPGNILYSNIELYNLGEVDKEVDVNLEYNIMDSAGKNILRQTEMIAVNTKIGFVKEFTIPPETDFGKYVLYVRATYNESIASASAWFNVGKVPSISLRIVIIIFSALIAITIVIIILRRRKVKKHIKYKIDETALKGTGMIKR